MGLERNIVLLEKPLAPQRTGVYAGVCSNSKVSGGVIKNLLGDARLIQELLPYDGSVEIYLITFPDGQFYLGQHKLPKGMIEDLGYLGSGERLPKEGRTKHQLLRVPKRWANLVEEILARKYRQEPLCLNSPHYTRR